MAIRLGIYWKSIVILLFVGMISCKNANSDQIVDPEESNSTSIEEQSIKFPPFDPDIVNGRWESQDTTGYHFSITLISDEDVLNGQYCSINAKATRIDCGLEEENEYCYIKGEIKDNLKQVLLDIVSCRSLKHGKARLTILDDGSIDWRLIAPPGEFGVDHLAPKEANLIRVSSEL